LIRQILVLLVFAAACGARTELDAMDASTPNEPVYCSFKCGNADASTAGAVQCAAGQICGNTGGVAGNLCCDPSHCFPTGHCP